MADLVSIIYSFSARLYGQRRAKRKTEKIVQELNAQAQTEEYYKRCQAYGWQPESYLYHLGLVVGTINQGLSYAH